MTKLHFLRVLGVTHKAFQQKLLCVVGLGKGRDFYFILFSFCTTDICQ